MFWQLLKTNCPRAILHKIKGEIREMAISKTRATTFAIALLLAMVISIVALPLANGQIGATMKTYPFVDITPNPVGVGEETLVRFGISQQLGRVEFGWSGLAVTIVDPNDNTIMLDNNGAGFKTDSTGGTATVWVPNVVGTYQFTAHFPEQTNPYGYFDYERGTMFPEGTVLLESTTEVLEVVVTEEPRVPYPEQPLPTEYWTRPIDPQLRIWSLIAGNWLQREKNSNVPYNDDAPETAHVLWTQPITTGGLTGGLWTDVPASSETGDAYEGKWANSIVLNGILYYREHDIDLNSEDITVAIDLHTGEELWRMKDTYDYGQVYYWNSFNYDGVYTWLVDAGGGGIDFYDPYDGKWMYGFDEVPSGTRSWGPSGEILITVIDFENGRMLRWNQTKAGHEHLGTEPSSSWGSWGTQVFGQTWITNGSRCYDFNVSIPTDLTYSTSFFAPILVVYPDRVMSIFFNTTDVRVWALNLDGSVKFDRWWSAPAEWEAGSNTLHYGGSTDDADGGIISVWSKELRKHYAFSTDTGAFLWETDSQHYLDWYGWGNVEHTWYYAYDHLYATGVGGILYAYDQATGDLAWTYEMDDEFNEPVTGIRWWGWITLIADGKIYLGTLEHSAEQPLPRGAPLVCLNATTGEVIFRVNGMYRATRWGGNAVMGDSIYATMDTYDQRVYAVGKGPTMTTVTAPDNGVPFGSSVMIRGTVKDVSPGTKSPELTLRFPTGVSAVADANQSEWMKYVYKQFSYDPHETWIGVEVDLYVVDANMNARPIGTATTSAENGAFAFAWTPDIPGTFYLYAEFKGSKAYFGSHAETAFVVDEAPESTPMPTAEPESIADAYILPSTIGIIVAIVVIGLIIILMLRKR